MPDPATKTAAICPVCGQNNLCALANPATATQPCWCYSVIVDPQVLANPAAQNSNSCLCPQCAQAEQTTHTDAS